MFARRLVAFTKVLVMGAGAVTALCMAAIVSMQFGFWLLTRTWSPLPVSRFLELADLNIPRRYLAASIDTPKPSQFDKQGIIESLLDLPAIVVLFVGLTVFALLYAALTSFDRGLAGHKT